jgi:ketosteroid isomerase-like protein
MNIFVIVALLALVPTGAALLFFFRTLSSKRTYGTLASDGLVFSPGKYRPMERLLRADDFSFLSGQPGYSPRMGRRFRQQRRKIFRAYLRNLKRDFGALSLALQTLIVHSADDRGDLAAALARQRLAFTVGILAVEGRLLLHAAGMSTIQVDVRELVASVEAMQTQMGVLLAPPPAALAAV